MMYALYEFQSDVLRAQRDAAAQLSRLTVAFGQATGFDFFRPLRAGCDLFTRMKFRHTQPPFDIDNVTVDGREVAVSEEITLCTPFGDLLHFRKHFEDSPRTMPKVLVVAPLSGHFSTLLRDTVRVLLPDHDVYITNWLNARDVSQAAGRFGFEEYVDLVIRFLETLGPRSHVLAVCQPCAQVLAAVSVMAEDENPAQPCSMTLMAGPVDTRFNPTAVNKLALRHSLEWFEEKLIFTVPAPHPGAGRRVYPGFLQLSAFMFMNMNKHTKAFQDFYRYLLGAEEAKAGTIGNFYDEYFAVLDLPAEFYLETVDIVFQRTLLAKGKLTHRGRRVDPSKIRHTALLTVEAERDDICGLGQTAAAHDLCSSLPPYMKRHLMQPGVGHYGVFSGRRWESQVYPMVRSMMLGAS
ncbi:MAG: polyhydroxyalkanoate depolymerase [Pseudomonadota bacterium]|nr:polyhydroxyalkanoate depolymerase [Pseudomonadota bacterium]